MPTDDHNPVQGNGNAKNNEKGFNKPQKSHREQGEHGENYASKMWHKIEGAVTKDKMSGLKQEFNQEGGKKHRKRHRRKRYGEQHFDGQQKKIETKPINPFAIGPKEPSLPDFSREPISQTEPVIPETPISTETVQPKPLEPEETPPLPPVMPVNPFALPPKGYEPFVKEKVKKEKQKKELEKKEKEISDEASDVSGHEEVKPINPFEFAPSAKPLDDRSLDEKPLDRVGKVTEPEPAFYQESSSPQETGESQEAEVTNVKEFVAEPSKEEEYNEPKEQIKEIVPEAQAAERKIEPVFPENLDKEHRNEDFKEDLWSVLQQAGITKRKAIVILIVLLLVLGIGLFFIFGGYKIFISGKDNSGRNAKTEKSQTVTKPSGDISDTSVIGERPYDIISAFIFGLEYKPAFKPINAEPIGAFGDFSGVFASFIFGKIQNLKSEQFIEYVQLLEKMDNIYQVDIYSLLDLAINRRKALDDYLKELDGLIQDGTFALSNIEADLKNFDSEYETLSKQANEYESSFFQYVQNFYGQTAYDTLQSFINSSDEAVKLKAQYSAENTLKTMFINSLNALKPRYKDAAVNTETLIKGIKVFDIPKSNINTIIPLE